MEGLFIVVVSSIVACAFRHAGEAAASDGLKTRPYVMRVSRHSGLARRVAAAGRDVSRATLRGRTAMLAVQAEQSRRWRAFEESPDIIGRGGR